MVETTDPTVTLVDFACKMGNAVQRIFRLERRSAYAKTGTNSLLFGGTDLTAPTFSVGDADSATTKLAVGSYTSPGTNA